VTDHEAGWAKNELFRRLLAMKDRMNAEAARQAAKALAAAASASPPMERIPPAPPVATPVQPAPPKSAEIISLHEAALKAGFYIPAGSRNQSLADEFPPDPVTSNWRATSNQAPPKYEPDTTDISGDGINRAYEAQQVRVAKEKKS
jgi:hypothetical protein